MEIEIRMFSGSYQDVKAPANTLDEVVKLLNEGKSEDFITLDTPKGPVIINKRNILSVKKK